jgi:hypothetical protein
MLVDDIPITLIDPRLGAEDPSRGF